MRVGIDSFTIRELNLDPCRMMDYVEKLGLEGIQFDGLEAGWEYDPEKLKSIKQYAESKGMYAHMSIDFCNPLLTDKPEPIHREHIVRQIRACAYAGFKELRTVISFSDERYIHPIPWAEHLSRSAAFISSLRPELEESGCRVNIENHGDTTFEIVQLVEQTGPDICGICLDTANTFVNAEDPVLAAKRVAPYTHLTHIKDGILFFSSNGVSRQGKTPGQGVVPFEEIIAILGKYNPQLPLSIEDHKWIFEFGIFDREWMDRNPHLTAYELAQFIRLTRDSEKKLASGEFPEVEVYEAIPYAEQMEERLLFGTRYLNDLLRRLHLYG